MTDAFRRIGRGGAGNFISAKDVEQAEEAQRQTNDPESPKPSSTDAPPVSDPTAPQPHEYVRSGRGGAGNFSEPPTMADSLDREDVVDRTRAAVNASQAGKPRAGLSGRGGAGNWTDNTAKKGDAGEKSKQQEIADKIKHDIDASLPPPPKTYHQHDRDMEK